MLNKNNLFNLRRPLIAILRGITPLEAESVSDVLIEAGIKIIEVPLNSPRPYETIERMAKFHGNNGIFGAGTVLNEDEVSMVADAGGNIIVSPNSNPLIIKKTKELNLLSFPGVFTPTECFEALDAGADGLKFFPASLLEPKNFKALSAVLPDNIISIAVGGIDETKFPIWLDVKITGFGLGSNLYKPGMLLDDIKARAEKIVQTYDNSLN
ncbi:2-dehydro-3-deoxy-6-phosphogalactonate aldolase [Alphaproteobacteria bacterium]|nr:2-dehydro-3-deoxy-6-phosphogalactonate aldolase [Alphaproteobacteria bacterium]